MHTSAPAEPLAPFSAARFIKEIGRGKNGARSMSRTDAEALYGAMLQGRVSDLELGGILLSMRIKGESVEEIAGFLDAAEASFAPLAAPPGEHAPVVIPSYNGARKMANLTALLALLLARRGVPVLVHGVASDPGRITTAEVFQALGLPAARSHAEAEAALDRGEPAFIAIDDLAPQLAHLLSLRRILGVRNSTHTLVKIMQPFTGPALRLVSYTHPEYLEMLGEYFVAAAPHARGDAFLMRGTEGETVANANKAQQIDWFHDGRRTLLVEKQTLVQSLPVLPVDKDAATTAQWIQAVLRGEILVPESIAEQVEQCLAASRGLAQRFMQR
ncbi:DNA-binding protein YbiB [Janthinobacterium agaricidamnosum]|uniref:Glycosyl transferase family, helical bundle domain protein n=1 Tax=Janthinobacterium agaricidamnosum NBRC 102515 = DSM 9628 TaxID=1349767 RepID=W0V1Q8_9BURK|nr:DNA-binding protein YbiB [Janthinobacterium agaricidamnosum]CDG81540.1 glycosyl transferase family, helical bundle domain protein [Janthinobacterium agaricidamnosum NBRC 102515 = DSM 9628]